MWLVLVYRPEAAESDHETNGPFGAIEIGPISSDKDHLMQFMIDSLEENPQWHVTLMPLKDTVSS